MQQPLRNLQPLDSSNLLAAVAAVLQHAMEHLDRAPSILAVQLEQRRRDGLLRQKAGKRGISVVVRLPSQKLRSTARVPECKSRGQRMST